jgi:hypothetical protein
MSGEGGPSRRTLLRRVAGVGAVGLATGSGTHALVTEYETFAANTLQSQALDLRLAYADGGVDAAETAFPTTYRDTNGVTVDLGDLAPGDRRTLRIASRVRPCDQPVALWMRVTGNVDSAAASLVRMRVVRHEDCEADGGYDWTGTVSDVVSASGQGLERGIRFDADCTAASAPCDSPTCLAAEWWIPEDETVSLSAIAEELSISFEFVGQQCTDPQSAGGNPWNE